MIFSFIFIIICLFLHYKKTIMLHFCQKISKAVFLLLHQLGTYCHICLNTCSFWCVCVCQVGSRWRRTTSSTAGTPPWWTTSRGRRSSSGPSSTTRTCWRWRPCRWPSCWRKRWSSSEPTSTGIPTVRDGGRDCAASFLGLNLLQGQQVPVDSLR